MRAGRWARLSVVSALTGIILVATAAPAWAHAVIQTSSPPDKGVVAQSPRSISLTVNENVEVSFGAVRLFTCAGKRITLDAPRHASGDDKEVVVGVPGTLDPGTYIVSWHVISADSHPVGATFTFSVGSSSGGATCATETSAKSSPTVGILFGTARGALFTGLALLIGGMVFLVLIARGTSAAGRTRVAIWTGWVVVAVSTVAGVMLQGPYAAGSGAGDAVKWTVIRDVLHTRYGHVATVRLVLLVPALLLLAFLGRASRHRRPPLWWLGGSAIVAIGLAATPGYAGHAATGDFTIFAVPLDTIHVLAMSVWLGGLVVLVIAALGGGFSGGLRRALTTFSRLAFWSVVVLVLSGLFASWRQVGFAVDGYLHTSYGNILLSKLGIVVALVGLAAVSRSIVRKRQSAPLDAPDSVVAAIDERTVGGLRKSVASEVVLGLAVLAVTAMLVNAQPARSALAPKLFSTTIHAGTGESAMLISVTVDPARVGSDVVHVYTETTQGENLTVRDISATFVSTDGTTKVPANLVKGGPNHFLTNSVAIPAKGQYQLAIQVLQIKEGRLIDTAASAPITIR